MAGAARTPSSRAPRRGRPRAGPGSGGHRPASTPAARARPRRRPPLRGRCRGPAARPGSPSFDAMAESTTSPLTGTCLAAARGSRSTSSATPSETATSTPTVRPFRSSASPMANARRTPSTTAALRWSAVRIDARTETWTTTRAVSGARTGSGAPVTAGDRPGQPGRQPRLGDRADLGRRRRRPRDGVGQPPPPSPDTTAEPTGESCRHDRRYRRSPSTALTTHVHTLGRRGCRQPSIGRRGQNDAHQWDRRTTREAGRGSVLPSG